MADDRERDITNEPIETDDEEITGRADDEAADEEFEDVDEVDEDEEDVE